jgi:K+ transporter
MDHVPPAFIQNLKYNTILHSETVLSRQVGRDSNPDSLCATVSGMETRPTKQSLPGLIEKLPETAFFHFRNEDIPRVPSLEKIEVEKLGGGFYRVIAQ